MNIKEALNKMFSLIEDSKVTPMTINDEHIIPMMPDESHLIPFTTEDKPKISKTKWDGTADSKWWIRFNDKWYGGDTPQESYENCKKFHYPKDEKII
jgi:hypothetical protein